MTAPKKRTAILISGRGSNLAALADASLQPGFAGAVTHVVSNRPHAAGLEFARLRGIATRIQQRNAPLRPAAQHGERMGALEDGEVLRQRGRFDRRHRVLHRGFRPHDVLSIRYRGWSHDGRASVKPSRPAFSVKPTPGSRSRPPTITWSESVANVPESRKAGAMQGVAAPSLKGRDNDALASLLIGRDEGVDHGPLALLAGHTLAVLHADHTFILLVIQMFEDILIVYLTCCRLIPPGIVAAMESCDLTPCCLYVRYQVTLGNLLMIHILNDLA